MSDHGLFRADHIENLSVGNITIGGRSLQRQVLQCTFPPGTTPAAAYRSLPLSYPDDLVNSRQSDGSGPFHVPPNARIIGVTVLPDTIPSGKLKDRVPSMCAGLAKAEVLTDTTASSLCVGFMRCNAKAAYVGPIRVPVVPVLTNIVTNIDFLMPLPPANAATTLELKAATTVDALGTTLCGTTGIQFSNVGIATINTAQDNAATTNVLTQDAQTVDTTTAFQSNPYQALYRYFSPMRSPIWANANRAVGVVYENSDALLAAGVPQYFEWNAPPLPDTENPHVQMILTPYTPDRIGVWAYVNLNNAVVMNSFKAATVPMPKHAGTFLNPLGASGLKLLVELVYEIDSITQSDEDKARYNYAA
jgi:hypothetical protein